MTTSFVGALVRAVRNATPVPYTARRGGILSTALASGASAEQQMRAMGAVGTLFAIVNRTSNATAQVEWGLWRAAPSGDPADRVKVQRHAALDLWRRPNPFMPRQEFVEVGQQHLDLTGENWWVVARNGRIKLPQELWPVRPDRMRPNPSPTEFITGYTYTSPEGQEIPLGLDEVVFLRMPNPLDPYRGMGPVQSILVDLDSSRFAKEWNRAFFYNSAEPGGIIEVDKRLSDPEFDEMNARWQEQHKGIGNAHRVAIIEQGHWIDRNVTQRDMQFVEGMGVTRDAIREAFGIPKFAVGDIDDVNRATADASDRWFAKHLTTPRLERFKGALNNDLLPLYGPTVAGLEFDYCSPVLEDAESANAERDSKVNAAVALIAAGFDRAEVLAAFELPDIAVAATPPAPAVQPAPAPPVLAPAARLPAARALPRGRPRNAEPDLDPADLPDVTPLQDDWEAALADLLAAWAVLSAAQKDQLVADVKAIAESGALTDLTDLTVDSDDTAAELAAAMAAIAAQAAGRVVEEADAQGVTVTPRDAPGLVPVATVVAANLGQGLVLSASSAAMRANGPAATPDDIADAVRAALDDLTDAIPEQQLGGALTGAQNAARVETLRLAPEGAIYANERNDKSTCLNCRSVNGKWLGNISDMDQIEKSYPGGAYGGYINCLGRERCRGTVTGVWR